MISSPNHSSRNGAVVRILAGHTAEGARTADNLGAYFGNPDVEASSHVGIDYREVEQYVDYSRYSWTLLNGNPISDNAELCGFAMMTRAQWLSEETITFWHPELRRNVTVDHPRRMLDNFAAWLRQRALARGIPIRKIDAAAVDRGEWGIIGHIDWTYSGIGQGDHVDPEGPHYRRGTGFPWDYVIAKANDPNTAPPAGGGGSGSPVGWQPATEFPLPGGHYFGDWEGPEESHGGFYEREKVWVAQVQTALQKSGHAPNVPGWADGLWESPTTDAINSWQRAVGRPQTGRADKADWDLLILGRGGAPAPTPTPPAGRVAPKFPLPADHWFGDWRGGPKQHGGFYESEMGWVREIQWALQRWGYAPAAPEWADGKWDPPTTEAMAAWQRDHMPGTTFYGQCWWDDWAKLLSR